MRAVPFAWLFGGATTVIAFGALADTPEPERDEPRAAHQAERAPRAHFEQALVHYRAGRYRAAIIELNAAIALDPESKDLVYNLALVHEKLGELDPAIAALERYVELEADEKELTRARQAIERMRGARAELAHGARAAAMPAVLPPRLPEVEPPRVDSWLLATSGISAAAAVVGVVFGVRALSLRPGSAARTDATTSLDDLRRQQERAERLAFVADVSFAISLAAGSASAALWFGREPARRDRAAESSVALSWRGLF